MREDRQRLVYDVLRRYERGESIRQIGMVKGIARKTVRRIVRGLEQRRADGDDALLREGPRPRAPRLSKLDRYVELVTCLIKQYPDITAQRVFEELRADGFDGKYSIVRDYIRELRPKRARRAHDPVHTAPGQQAQADWSPYRLEGGEPIQAFSIVLHHSRYQWADFAHDRQRITLLRHLVDAFADFGGVPWEIVFDSEKTVVDRWELGQPIVNLTFLDFAAYYGFAVHIAPRADGAYKGCVERPFWFFETNLFNGRTFRRFDEARRLLRWWLDERANPRIHRSTRRRPDDMLAEELPAFKPLPPHPYDTSEIGWRIVSGLHRIEHDTNTYTVPRNYVGHRVCVRATANTLEIYDGFAKLLARHERAPRGAGHDSELPEHRRQPRIDIDKVIERFDAWGEAASRFAANLREGQRYAGVELCHILDLQSHYRLEDILAAIDHALAYRACTATALQRILQAKAQPLVIQDIVAQRVRAEIRRTLVKAPVRQRPLTDYQGLFSQSDTPDDPEDENGPCDPNPTPTNDS
jgi:transposase